MKNKIDILNIKTFGLWLLIKILWVIKNQVIKFYKSIYQQCIEIDGDINNKSKGKNDNHSFLTIYINRYSILYLI